MSWERLTTGIQVALWNPVNACPQVPAMLSCRSTRNDFGSRFITFAMKDSTAPSRFTGGSNVPMPTWSSTRDCFVEDYSYLGLLLKEGRSLGGKKHHSWQGLFAAEPTDNNSGKLGYWISPLMDLQKRPPSYREAAQSLMLLDRSGKLRVRDSGKRAYQTVVAEDQHRSHSRH